jgi:hypothetical protein
VSPRRGGGPIRALGVELAVDWCWAAEVEALSEVHAVFLHERQRFGVLDALGDRFVAELPGQSNDRPDEVLTIAIGREVAHEINVDLECPRFRGHLRALVEKTRVRR